MRGNWNFPKNIVNGRSKLTWWVEMFDKVLIVRSKTLSHFLYNLPQNIFHSLSEKRNESASYILCCSSWEEGRRGDSLENHQDFEEHLHVQI